MKNIIASATVLLLGFALTKCGDSGPTTPVAPVTTTTTAPATPQFQITSLITVYKNAGSFAEWSQATTQEERLGEIILGVSELSPGRTVFNNEVGRFELQQAIDRITEQFEDADYVSAFDETKENLARYFDDADNDGWSVDGRFGVGRDWPHDSDGNDPNGWTGQIVVTVERDTP